MLLWYHHLSKIALVILYVQQSSSNIQVYKRFENGQFSEHYECLNIFFCKSNNKIDEKYNVMKAAYPEFKFLSFKQNRNRKNTGNGVQTQEMVFFTH